MKGKKTISTGNPRGRGPYNVACDVCARKKIKCDGIKPVCQPCVTQGRERECTWAKNPARKPRTEAFVEAMHKQTENLRKCNTDNRNYTEFLEKQLEECYQYLPQRRIDFRASRPADPDSLMAQPEDDSDLMGEDENDQGSDDGNDPTVMSICIPPQSLQVEPFTQPSRFPALAGNPDGTYVLYVDGVYPSHYNPNFDWSRNLTPNVPFKLDRPTHDKALDLLFKFCTSWCLRIVPALFLKDMFRALRIPPFQAPPKTPHYSPMLHNALVAVALAFLDEPFNDMKIRQCYANYAKSFIESECRKPNLSVVQALSILSTFHSSQGDQTLGYLYFGMSARISQALGLNIDFSEWVKLGIMDEAERLDRHWASWTNFAQDVCWSLYVGRDFCVAEPVDAKVNPLPHVDPEFDKISWFHLPAAIAPQPNNLTITFEATCKLLKIGRRIMDFMNGSNKARSRPFILDDLASDIDGQLNMWKSSLTDELDLPPRSLLTPTPHKLMLHLAYWWFMILLHRPFFGRKSRPIHMTDRETDHVELCRRAAEQIMDLLATWRNLYKLRYCPVTLIQTVFSAGTVYVLIAATSGIPVADDKEFRNSLHQETLVQQYLQEIGISWHCAASVSANLNGLKNEHVSPLLNILDRKNASAGLRVLDIGDDEEENDSDLSRSSSRKRSPTSNMQPRQRLSYLLNPSNNALTSSISSTQVSPSQADPSNSPTITISSTPDASSTHAPPSVSPNSNHQAFVHRDFQGYPYTNNPFSGNGEDVGLLGDQGSAHNIQPLLSPLLRGHSVTGGMLGGQTLSETPFFELFNNETDFHGHRPNFSTSLFGNGFLNHGSDSSSFGNHVLSSGSHGENDNMNLDNPPWRQSFPS